MSAQVIRLFPEPPPKPSAQVFQFPMAAIARRRAEPARRGLYELELQRGAEVFNNWRRKHGLPDMTTDEVDQALRDSMAK